MFAFNGKNFKTALFLLLAAVFIAISVFAIGSRGKECLGVPILEKLPDSQYQYADLSALITHHNRPAAVDTDTNTIYISQPVDDNTHYTAFKGALNLDSAEYKLYFAPDAAFDDTVTAIRNGHNFRLLAVSDDSYMEYNVVFSSLPVIKLDGEYAYTRTENKADSKTDILSGQFTVWTPYDPEIKGYSSKSSALEYHIRGNAAATHSKPPYKLAFKAGNGENNHLNLFGFGGDDDWILNALSFDDTRIREKVLSDLWNEMCETSPHNTKMVQMQYCEAVINGQYRGLYMLQRRIDAKLLGLSEHDILAKGMRNYVPEYSYHAYNIIHTNLEEGYVYALLDNYFKRTDMSAFNVDNFIDINLFIQFAYSRDNRLYNNMYFIMKASPEGYKTSMLMWDMDISFGKTGVAGMDYDLAVNGSMEREDTDSIRALHPDYDARAYERWKEFREYLFTEQHVFDVIDYNMEIITRSHSLQRDDEVWYKNVPEDSLDLVKQFVTERLPVADKLLAERAGQ